MSARSDYREAERRILQALDQGSARLALNDLSDLRQLPEVIRDLPRLRVLDLSYTHIADLGALSEAVDLHSLNITGTQVDDMRPIAGNSFASYGEGTSFGLLFAATPAAQSDPELSVLSKVSDDRERTEKTLAYLRSLPPSQSPSKATTSPVPPIVPGDDARNGDPTNYGRTARQHIAFILQTAAASESIAAVAAEQIRAALNDVEIPKGRNRLPEPLRVFEDLAAVLDNLARHIAAPQTANRRDVVATEIARLETLVETLTAQLADATTRAETAEAALAANPNWQAYKTALAPKAADMTIWLAKAGVISGTLHFLGTASPIAQGLLGLLSRI